MKKPYLLMFPLVVLLAVTPTTSFAAVKKFKNCTELNKVYPGGVALPGAVNAVGSIMGAGASIVGIAAATTALAPKYRLFPLVNGGIPLWVLTLIFLVLDFSTAIVVPSILVSHLFAGLVGFGYMKLLQNGNNAGDWMIRFYHWGSNLLAPKNTRIVKADTRGFDSSETKLNAILDKMNMVGYENLSEEEKAFLKSASQE
jgi:hypothetical protein